MKRRVTVEVLRHEGPAGLRVGVWRGLEGLRDLARDARRFEPKLPEAERRRRLERWRRAVETIIEFHQGER